MRRIILAAVFALALAGQPQSLRAVRDRYFTIYPFERWLTEPDQSQLRWTAHVRPAKLTPHQRIASGVEIEIDNREVSRRRGRGELVTLVQIEDSTGRTWRIHNTYDLARIPADSKPHGLVYSQEFFLVPGDYKLAMATCDSETHEYSFTRRNLHVAELRGETLSQAWAGLPAVEFVRPLETPDIWFQPYIRGHLKVGVQSARPIHVDLVMNMTPSERASGSLRVFRRNMSVLVPSLKVLAGMDISKGSLDVTLLDLTRQKTWEQIGARGLDWMKMRTPLADTQPGVIDAQSLGAKAQMVRFFRDQVLDRLRGKASRDELRVVIVLSAPAFLEHQYRLDPVTLEHDPNRKIFYIRYRPIPNRPPPGPMPDGGLMPAAASIASDDLEHALKPLDARVFTASSPEEFRKALSSMLTDIQKM